MLEINKKLTAELFDQALVNPRLRQHMISVLHQRMVVSVCLMHSCFYPPSSAEY
ncbi:hypothetical protein IX324_002689 [Bacteroides pyogenes]|nr:hypothetical protein [Bacteroides pyogenes]